MDLNYLADGQQSDPLSIHRFGADKVMARTLALQRSGVVEVAQWALPESS